VDRALYPTGIKVTDEELNDVNLHRDTFHGDWNSWVLPRKFKRVIS
jgi:hypothetical protein